MSVNPINSQFYVFWFNQIKNEAHDDSNIDKIMQSIFDKITNYYEEELKEEFVFPALEQYSNELLIDEEALKPKPVKLGWLAQAQFAHVEDPYDQLKKVWKAFSSATFDQMNDNSSLNVSIASQFLEEIGASAYSEIITIPKSVFLNQLDAYKSQSYDNFDEGQINIIDFEYLGQELPEKDPTKIQNDIRSFVNCLKSGSIEGHVNPDNALSVLVLANMQQVNWLTNKCVSFVFSDHSILSNASEQWKKSIQWEIISNELISFITTKYPEIMGSWGNELYLNIRKKSPEANNIICVLSSLKFPFDIKINCHVDSKIENWLVDLLSNTLTNNKFKSCLYLTSVTQFTQYGELFIEAVKVNRTLHYLKFDSRDSKKDFFPFTHSMLTALSKHPSIKKIDLQRYSISPNDLYLLLENNNALTSLHLHDNCLSEEALSSLSKGLSVNKSLTELEITLCKNAHRMERLAPGLIQSSSLKFLNLSYNGVFCENVVGFSKYFVRTNNLHSLVIRSRTFECFETIGALALVNALKQMTKLTELDIHGNKIGPDGAAALAKVIETHPSIVSLGLGNTAIQDTGIGFIANALLVNKTVTRLSLSLNTISESAKNVSELIANNRIVNLKLAGCKIDDKRAEVLVSGLKSNTTLNLLNLKGNKIEGKGAIEIAKAMREHPTIQFLNLADNFNDDITRKAFIETLSEHPNFETFNFEFGMSSRFQKKTFKDERYSILPQVEVDDIKRDE